MAKKKRVRLTTPVGVAKYPWLNKPDTKFDPQGVYRVQLALDPEKHEEFLARLDEMVEKSVAQAKADLRKNKPQDIDKIIVKPAYEKEYDSDGEETGMVEIKFKMKHIINTKNGDITLTPDLFDGKGNVINPKEVNIYGGSKMRINFTPRAYYMASTKMAGVSMQLNAVQVIELVERGSDSSFYGFGEVDDGFDSNVYTSSESGGDTDNEDDFNGGDDGFDVSEADF
jgi:hypothetical protein